ncbi:MAG: dTDP-4-dehydrorhamnose reductase [Hyphomicrobium sp.]|nr:dTDP-4-dehydrorhamnose reductase [Hyphomicrobium sp.]
MSAHPIAVTGASGQVARALQRAGARRASNLVVAGRPVIDVASHASVKRVLDGIAPGIVINAAAYNAVDDAERDEAAAFRINRDGPHYLAKWCAANGVPLIHISTGHVFDGSNPLPYRETDACCPANAFGRSKAAGEDAIRDVLAHHVIVRTGWVYSTDGRNFLKSMLQSAREREIIDVIADQYGTPTSADDIAAALLDICDVLLRDDGCRLYGTYHLAATGETTWYGFAKQIYSVVAYEARKAPRVEPILTERSSAPANRPKHAVLDTTKMRNAFGLVLPPWQHSVAACVRQMLAKESGFKANQPDEIRERRVASTTKVA